MFSYLDVYCDACCSMPGEFCTSTWTITNEGYPLAQASPTHDERIKRSKREAITRVNLLLPFGLPTEADPRCPGCNGTYEEHMFNDCFTSFCKPLPYDLPE